MTVRAGHPGGSCEHDGMRSRPSPIGIAGAATCATGLVLVAGGTFLPWFRSGLVLRDSYQSISLIRTIGVLRDSPLRFALDAWTMIVPVATLCIALYAIGLRHTAATIAAILAIVCGTIGGIAAVESGSNEASLGVAGTGPVIMLIGGALTLLGVAGIVAGQRRRARSISGGEL
ncbi:MAG: hypothetical protein ACJ72N_12465 [Labedaea sp.]